jgi:hypothetical protein
MTNLVSAYQDRNVKEAEKILNGKLSQCGAIKPELMIEPTERR